MHTIKQTQKQAQHALLLSMLKAQGYKVILTVFTLGTTGTIPTSTFQDLEGLGLEYDAVAALIQKLHLLAITHCGHIIYERRRREALLEPG